MFSVGGWALLLVPLVLALYGVALIAWFGSGMISAPIFVWLGSAALAATLAGTTSWHLGMPLALGLLLIYRLVSAHRQRKANLAMLQRREERSRSLPAAAQAVVARATEAPAADTRELSLEELQALRYNLDLALQPLEGFDGFQTVEQFQTSALRYQLNNIDAGYLYPKLSWLQQPGAAQYHREDAGQASVGVLALGAPLGAFLDSLRSSWQRQHHAHRLLWIAGLPVHGGDWGSSLRRARQFDLYLGQATFRP
jgi:hypothetical protein